MLVNQLMKGYLLSHLFALYPGKQLFDCDNSAELLKDGWGRGLTAYIIKRQEFIAPAVVFAAARIFNTLLP